MISVETYMKGNKRLCRKISRGGMDPTDETTGVTAAGTDSLLPLARLEGSRIIQILFAFNCIFLGANSR
jgi:hypothetical protein